ncbi:MAG: septum formation initiator family protein [Gemmobacter sp.]|nr:septum formation initiator family protein [Gemmobacter sp.]
MTGHQTRPPIGAAFIFMLLFVAGSYFTFAAVQGDHGMFRRIAIKAETEALTLERDQLTRELANLTNQTQRMSDSSLDLDLLDERARDVLGYLRADEVVTH